MSISTKLIADEILLPKLQDSINLGQFTARACSRHSGGFYFFRTSVAMIS